MSAARRQPVSLPLAADAPVRILLVKTGALGDVVYTLPLLDRLRRGLPRAFLAWLVEPRALPLLDGHPQLDEVIPFPRGGHPHQFWSLARALRAREFDIALDLQRLLKSGLAALASGAPVRLGFDRRRTKEGSHLFSNRRLPPQDETRHMVLQYLEFAHYLGVAACDVAFPLPPPFHASASPEAPCDVVLGIGAGKPANRWPDEHWAALVKLLSARGLRVALAGAGFREARSAARIREACRTPLQDFVGRAALPATAALIRRSRLYVGLDSGVTHLACALGHPVVALYGPADPRRTGPWGPRARVLARRPPCAPCGERHCPLATGACMSDLTPAEVAEAVAASLPS